MKNTIFIVAAVLIFFYVIVLYASTIGWGYAGYRGYHYGPSFWYWGGPRYYISTTTIRGGHRGGGPGSGK